ncbi:hypothetical protein WH8501_05620 [Crocosphaera watsonii WH 8501]|uniref:Uncharacterized protein n=4 Tax=Crocosphaera watsonii TaxID=263511 RepID=Q4BUJ5_CROWT|nr:MULTISPECIES: hypothetical protein [Crocosphaera]EAM47576.1 hypothetical protein CwatDRAFT_0307 [Crocosphaera watsonii WH 8501]EHJ11474.1 hypothetical protein CWATWH0003_3799 [Crocosphaera watsonii WH 0003]MCH2243032.1 hypothetical protein [Crocosphaera sp.]CCQ52237.1 hypothetical protein CWATWH8502_1605 [Crocosphaera watsonii WH 8502]CCQ69275.1 hypothetical protein CWATWH0402_2022 [Crocosphaera watsonii WH 0402]
MANPNPNLKNLEKGRGKKPKLGHKAFSVKLDPNEKEILEEIAKSYNCTYAGKGSISGLLSKIAQQNLMVVPAPLYTPSTNNIISINKGKVDIESGEEPLSPSDPIQEILDDDLLKTVEGNKDETSTLYKPTKT